MANNVGTNTSSGSTTWEWKRVKKRSASAPAGDSPSAARTSQPVRRRDSHSPLWIEVRYRGGASCSYLISFRGRKRRFDGVEALHDVMRVLNGEVGPWTK